MCRRPAGGSGRRVRLLLATLLVCASTLSCGTEGGAGDGTSRPTLSPTRTPSGTATASSRPSATRPEVSRSEADLRTVTRPDASGDEGLATPTRTPVQPDSSDEPSRETQPTQAPDTPSESPSAVPSASPADGADETDEKTDAAVPAWVWWTLVALVIASGVAMPWVLRSQRSRAWWRDTATQEAELAWLARELLPDLRRTGSVEQVAGGWTVARQRASAAEDRLTVLSSTAPDEDAARHATALREAVRRARTRVDGLTAGTRSPRWAAELDAAVSDLETALRPTPAQPD